MSALDVLPFASLALVAVLAVLAWRGRLQWGWVIGAAGITIALLTRSNRSGSVPHEAPPRAESGRRLVAPVLAESDAQSAELQADVSDANSDPDRAARLERLAAVNGGGRE